VQRQFAGAYQPDSIDDAVHRVELVLQDRLSSNYQLRFVAPGHPPSASSGQNCCRCH
jgi:hypothetical protein